MIATLEALSFGLPVVLSDIPAHRAVVEEYDATGECVPPESEAVKAAIDRIDRYENAHANVSLPEWDEVAKDYLELVDR